MLMLVEVQRKVVDKAIDPPKKNLGSVKLQEFKGGKSVATKDRAGPAA